MHKTKTEYFFKGLSLSLHPEFKIGITKKNKKRMKKRRFPLYVQILLGMLLGILAGFVAVRTGHGQFIDHWVRPWGQIFIKLLQVIAIPLVFCSLVKGVISLKDIAHLSRLGGRVLLIYIGTTVFAIVFGLFMALVVSPGKLCDASHLSGMEGFVQTAVESAQKATEGKERGPLAFFEDLVPENIVSAASSNQNMLQIIFFAILFGTALLAVPAEKTRAVRSFIDGLNEVMLKMVDFIILAAPVGVFALMASMVVSNAGNASVFSALAVYTLTVVVALLCMIFLFYPALIFFFSKMSPKRFIRAMYPVQLLGFTTSSSSATLPFNMETLEKKLGISEKTVSFVLPVGATINMDGTSCYQAIAVVFIAQVMGIHLDWGDLLSIVALTTISSIGTPGIPGGSYVILTMVLSSVGIPSEGLALILGVDRPLDMLRTSVNVTGDATVSVLVDTPDTDKA